MLIVNNITVNLEDPVLNKVVDYKILSSSKAPALEEHVKDYLSDGWTPSGPIFTHESTFHQTMVKFGASK